MRALPEPTAYLAELAARLVGPLDDAAAAAEAAQQALSKSRAAQAFIDEHGAGAVRVEYDGTTGSFKVAPGEYGALGAGVLFAKRAAVALTPANMQATLVVTTAGGPRLDDKPSARPSENALDDEQRFWNTRGSAGSGVAAALETLAETLTAAERLNHQATDAEVDVAAHEIVTMLATVGEFYRARGGGRPFAAVTGAAASAVERACVEALSAAPGPFGSTAGEFETRARVPLRLAGGLAARFPADAAGARIRALSERLDAIAAVRRAAAQLQRELAPGERTELRVDGALVVFDGVSALSLETEGTANWVAATRAFDARVRAAEEHVAARLCARLAALERHPHQVQLELVQRAALLQRAVVRDAVSDAVSRSVAFAAAAVARSANSLVQSNDATAALEHAVAQVRALEAPGQLLAVVGASGSDAWKQWEAARAAALTQRDRAAAKWVAWARDTFPKLEVPAATLETRRADVGERLSVRSAAGAHSVLVGARVLAASGVTLGARDAGDVAQLAAAARRAHVEALRLQQVAQDYNALRADAAGAAGPVGELLAGAASAVETQLAAFLQQRSGAGVAVDALLAATDRFARQQARAVAADAAIGALLASSDPSTTATEWAGILARAHSVADAAERDAGIPKGGAVAWRKHWDARIDAILADAFRAALDREAFLPDSPWTAELVEGRLSLHDRSVRDLSGVRRALYARVRAVAGSFVELQALLPGAPSRARLAGSYGALQRAYLRIEALLADAQAQTAAAAAASDASAGDETLAAANWVVLAEAAVADASKAASVVERSLARLQSRNSEPPRVATRLVVVSTALARRAQAERIAQIRFALVAAAEGRVRALAGDVIQQAKTAAGKLDEGLAGAGSSVSRALGAEAAARTVLERLEATLGTAVALERAIGGGTATAAAAGRVSQLKTACDAASAQLASARADGASRVKARWAPLLKALETAVASGALDEALAADARDVLDDARLFHVELQGADLLETATAAAAATARLRELESAFARELGPEAVEGPAGELWAQVCATPDALDALISRWAAATTDCEPLFSKISAMRAVFPGMARIVGGEAWAPEHWAALQHLTGLPAGGAALRAATVLECAPALIAAADRVRAIAAEAESQAAVRQALGEAEAWLAGAQVQLRPALGSDVLVVAGWDGFLGALGDQLGVLATLADVPAFAPLRPRGAALATRLAALDGAFRLLQRVQRRWVRLGGVLVDRGLVPADDVARFGRADAAFRAAIAHLNAHDGRATALLSAPAGADEDALKSADEQLERCQRALRDALEQKRRAFPRFYFLADDDLLELWGPAQRDARVVQTHLGRLFAGVHRVHVRDADGAVVAMAAADGEQVSLAKPVAVRGVAVEQWLAAFAAEMQRTLREMLTSCVKGRESTGFPAQVRVLAGELQFTARVDSALAANALTELAAEMRNSLSECACAAATADSTDPVVRRTTEALVLAAAHHAAVAESLAGAQPTQRAWLWDRQLRYYRSDRGNVTVRLHDAEFEYAWEYLGSAPALVHTPLTDRCYLVLTQAMRGGFGGNPFGPAGTGKTESVKALGAALGRHVLVFNCDDALDHASLARMLAGLVRAGAWGCFDEFNRLAEAVLSAVSRQLGALQSAVQARAPAVTLDPAAEPVPLHANAAVFVTLNPPGKRYGARSRLPDNLVQLLRAVAMAEPDAARIAAALLLAAGLSGGRELGARAVLVYALCRQVLSPQRHYDWGLRALKANLSLAGDLWRSGHDSEKAEGAVVVAALRQATRSKLAPADAAPFEHILTSVFGPSAAPVVESKDVKDEKSAQFADACARRMGIVLLGAPGTGKTTVWQRARTEGTHVEVLGPKTLPRDALLGRLDPDTRAWTDGVLTAAIRQAAARPGPSWIVCDGTIDPDWIEALNSVLDDNRLLTLPSGERIQLDLRVSLVFETDSLRHASPATVSRMGMVFLGEDGPDDEQVLAGISGDVPDSSARDTLMRAARWLRRNCPEGPVPPTAAALVRTAAHLFRTSGLSAAVSLGIGGSCSSARRRELLAAVGLADSSVTLPEAAVKLEGAAYTPALRAHAAAVRTWLDAGPVAPLLLVMGPPASGKATTVRAAAAAATNVRTVELACCAFTRAADALALLSQHCIATPSGAGRAASVLKPRGPPGSSLVLLIRGLDRVRPDEYGCTELASWLHLLVAHGGFHNPDSRDWIAIDHVRVVITAAGSFAGAPRLVSAGRVYALEDPSQAELAAWVAHRLPNALGQSRAAIDGIAADMVAAWSSVATAFPPTVHPHYRQTPRELVRWADGLQRYGAVAPALLRQAVAHEGVRVLCDRLVDASSRQRASRAVHSAVSAESLGPEDNTWFPPASKVSGEPALVHTGPEDLVKTLETARDAYTANVAAHGAPMIVVHRAFARLAAAVARVLTPGGPPDALVAAACGNGFGRATATRLVAHSLGASVVTVQDTKADIRRAVLLAADPAGGLEAPPPVALLVHEHVATTSVLATIDALLAAGAAPGLLTADERTAAAGNLRELHAAAGSQESLPAFLDSRVRQRLRPILAIDAAALPARLAQFPGLLARSSLNYLDELDAGSLRTLANTLAPPAVAAAAVAVVETRVPAPLAPVQTAHLVRAAVRLREQRAGAIAARRAYLERGLGALKAAADSADALRASAQTQGAEAAAKKREADAALQRITDALTAAAAQRQELRDLGDQVAQEQTRIDERTRDANAELASVEPILQEARLKVGDIRSDALSEIRSLRAPPPVVRDVLEGVLRLMGNLDTSWNSMKVFLGQRTVKEQLLNFDARRVDRRARDAVASLIKDKPDSFSEALVRKASVAAAPLAAWTVATVQYAAVLERIAPLENELAKLAAAHAAAVGRVDALNADLQTVDDRVAQLRTDFGALSADAARLEAALASTTAQLAAATELLDQLSGEGARWQQQADALAATHDALNVHCVLAAAALVSYAHLGEDDRAAALRVWADAAGSQHPFSLASFFGVHEPAFAAMRARGLASDDALAAENAVLLLDARAKPPGVPTPILVDPTGAAAAWLAAELAARGTPVEAATPATLAKQLERAVRFGKTLLVTSVSQIDPLLFTVLRGDLVRSGARAAVALGAADHLVECHPDFALILATRDARFAVPPAAVGHVAPVSFVATRAGLAAQLLAVVLDVRSPSLATRQRALTEAEDADRAEIERLQDALLQALAAVADAGGNLLGDAHLRAVLAETHATAAAAAKRLEDAQALRSDVESARAKYRPVAHLGTALFTAAADLQRLSPMYQLPLPAFLRLVRRTVIAGAADESPQDLATRLVHAVLAYGARALFDGDRLAWALHLARAAHPDAAPPEDWDALSAPGVQTVGKSQVATVARLRTDAPDRFEAAATELARQLLGVEALQPGPLDYTELHARETDAQQPVLLVTAPGLDPVSDIRALAASCNANLAVVAMGQGQGPAAVAAVREAQSAGSWVFLQNLHLAVAWLPELEAELLAREPHADFRLWLATEPHPRFPNTLLQLCLPLSLEPEPGLKQNLRRTLAAWAPARTLAATTAQHAQALFALAWFHAVVQERRMFVPQGWTRAYEFSQADLRAAVPLVHACFAGEKDGNAVRGLIGHAIYGGRLDAARDAARLDALLGAYLGDSVLSPGGGTVQLAQGVRLPADPNPDAFARLVEDLPDDLQPATLALPANIARSRQTRRAAHLAGQLRALRRGGPVAVAAAELAPLVTQLRSSLGDPIVDRVDASDNLPPLPRFFALQRDAAVQLVRRLGADLADLGAAAQAAKALPSQDLHKLADQLLAGAVPDAWTLLYDPDADQLAPDVYVGRAAAALPQVSAYARAAASNAADPSAFCASTIIHLPHLQAPEAFLTVLRQLSATRLSVPVDQVVLVSRWARDASAARAALAKAAGGIAIIATGIHVQASVFSSSADRFVPVKADDPPFSPAPQCALAWVDSSSAEALAPARDHTRLPLYLSGARTTLIADLLVPTGADGSAAHTWLLDGTAFMLFSE